MAVRIVTDTTFDMPVELVKEHNVKVVPLKVVFGQTEYLSDVELSKREFYKKLEESEELPTTGQVNPTEFVEVFNEILEQGDEIVGMFIGSKLSGTYQSAFIALNQINSDKISIIDTETVCVSGLSALIYAAELASAGYSRTQIVSKVEAIKRNCKMYFIVDTLKYLKKGGRIKPTAAVFGEALKIKPILTINDGLVDTITKARGLKKAFAEVGHLIAHSNQTLDNKKVIVGHTNSPENLAKMTEWIYKNYTPKELVICEVGSVVGTHAGPGGVALSFIEE